MNPGISMAELAELGTFDNCTVTRAVRKLANEGYLRIVADEKDRRAKKLYLTEEGKKLIDPIAQIRLDWFMRVTEGLTEEEKAQVGLLMGRLADNARACVDEQRKNHDCAEQAEDGMLL